MVTAATARTLVRPFSNTNQHIKNRAAAMAAIASIQVCLACSRGESITFVPIASRSDIGTTVGYQIYLN